jgi:hypothetical protein
MPLSPTPPVHRSSVPVTVSADLPFSSSIQGKLVTTVLSRLPLRRLLVVVRTIVKLC